MWVCDMCACVYVALRSLCRSEFVSFSHCDTYILETKHPLVLSL